MSTSLIGYSKKDYNNELYPPIQRKDRRELDSPPGRFVDNELPLVGRRYMYLVSISIIFVSIHHTHAFLFSVAGI